jgi:hypothetical protein
MNKDKQATLAGALLAALTASTVDFVKVTQFDRVECVKLGTALLFAVLGWVANKKDSV